MFVTSRVPTNTGKRGKMRDVFPTSETGIQNSLPESHRKVRENGISESPGRLYHKKNCMTRARIVIFLKNELDIEKRVIFIEFLA